MRESGAQLHTTAAAHLAGVYDDLRAANVDFLNYGGSLSPQRRYDACNVENSVRAFECLLDMGCVANITSHVGHAGMFCHWQQHVENGDAVLLGFRQKQLDDAASYKAAATCDNNDWT